MSEYSLDYSLELMQVVRDGRLMDVESKTSKDRKCWLQINQARLSSSTALRTHLRKYERILLEDVVHMLAINGKSLLVNNIAGTTDVSVPLVIIGSGAISATSYVFRRAKEVNIILLH